MLARELLSFTFYQQWKEKGKGRYEEGMRHIDERIKLEAIKRVRTIDKLRQCEWTIQIYSLPKMIRNRGRTL